MLPVRLRWERLLIRYQISGALNKGFTLLETLVAISILAISLVIILQLFSQGLKSSKLADDYTRAIFHAKEKMEEILLTEEFSEGELEGEFEGPFRWKAEVIRVEAEEEEATLPFDIFNVRVDVVWGVEGKESGFQISTMKIVEKSEDNEGA